MKTLLFASLCLLYSLGASAQLAPADEKAIRVTTAHWLANLNDHHFEELRTYTTPSVSMVNIMGMLWQGQAQVIRGYQRLFDTLYKGVPFQNSDFAVHVVGPDAAIANEVFTRGAAPSDSLNAGTTPPTRRAQITLFLVKQQGRWLIAAGQATRIDEKAIQAATTAMNKK
ncbi:MAG: hypothetical protein NVS3B25_17340 [Hymenobacter sp.]